MSEPFIFDEQKSFRDLLQRSKNIGDGWRQVSEALWPFALEQVAKQPGQFDVDEQLKRIRFFDYK